MQGQARTRLVAVVMLVAVAVPLVVVGASGDGDDEDEPSALRVERSTQTSEVILYVDDESANQSERASGRGRVTVECVDSEGTVIASQPESWPLTDTDSGTLAPHTHLPVNPARIGEVASCRIAGTDPLLEAPVL